MARRQAIDNGSAVIHCPDQTGRCEIGKADPRGVSMGALAQTTNEDVAHVRLTGRWLVPKGSFAAHNVGVHTCAADVLADFVHDEQVGLVKGKCASQRLAKVNRYSSRVSKAAGNTASTSAVSS